MGHLAGRQLVEIGIESGRATETAALAKTLWQPALFDTHPNGLGAEPVHLQGNVPPSAEFAEPDPHEMR